MSEIRYFKVVFTVLVSLIFATGCTAADITNKVENNSELRGVWFTYSEINAMVLSENGFEAEFSAAIEKCKTIGINNVFFHTVAFCDAVYPSEIYPFTKVLENSGSDILDIAVRLARQNGIKFHIWINPYRVSVKTNDINELDIDYSGKKAGALFNGDICFTENGIYLNPASYNVRAVIIGAVREIINNYDIDGIHFDDYFYPTADAEFDAEFYNEYSNGNENPLTLEEWRRVQVNSLIMGVYSTVKAADENLVFGISPAADLDYCYNTLFADVEGWIGGGYIDYVIPQIYFGFEYPIERYRFENLLTNWLDLTSGKTKMYIGLAAYKAGTDQEPDNIEWNADNTIIRRQIGVIRDNGIEGFVFFSYSSLFSDEAYNTEQLKEMKNVL